MTLRMIEAVGIEKIDNLGRRIAAQIERLDGFTTGRVTFGTRAYLESFRSWCDVDSGITMPSP
jgi:hypothetical protein